MKLQWVSETPPPRPNASQAQEDALWVTIEDERAERDAELERRWRDVEDDPALQLDMTAAGFYWQEDELRDASRVARQRLFRGSDELDAYMHD